MPSRNSSSVKGYCKSVLLYGKLVTTCLACRRHPIDGVFDTSPGPERSRRPSALLANNGARAVCLGYGVRVVAVSVRVFDAWKHDIAASRSFSAATGLCGGRMLIYRVSGRLAARISLLTQAKQAHVHVTENDVRLGPTYHASG